MSKTITDTNTIRFVLKRDELVKALDLILSNQPKGWNFYLYVGWEGIEFVTLKCVISFKTLFNLNDMPHNQTFKMVVEYDEFKSIYELLKNSQENEILLQLDGEYLSLEPLYRKKVDTFIEET